MSTYKKFDNVFKSDQELHKKFIEKTDKIKNLKDKKDKNDTILDLSMNGAIGGGIFSFITFFTLLMIADSLINELAKIVMGAVICMFIAIFIVSMVGYKRSGDKIDVLEKEIIEVSQSIDIDIEEKTKQDLKNLYNAKMSEDKPLINISSDEPKNEVVLENGDTVSAVLKYNNDGLLIMKTFSKIETATPNTDYVKQPKQPYDVIEDLNNIDE